MTADQATDIANARMRNKVLLCRTGLFFARTLFSFVILWNICIESVKLILINI